MKLSELRPCDQCGGPIAPMFYIVRTSMAMVKPNAANQVLGLSQMFNGALGPAEVMSPDSEAVMIMGDEDPELQTENLICNDCYMSGNNNLALLSSKQD